MTAQIRPYRAGDRAAVYDICVETGNAGQGVRGRYSTDDLLPDIVAGPYLYLEPEHAYVLDNGERAVGYIIGTASTPGFVAAYSERWLPRLRARYQPLSGPPVTEEEHRLDVMFHPERLLLPELAPHPAHLHINLLADYRRSGHGRALISTFLASVAAAGAGSCYLGVRQANVNARRFYERLGWRPVEVRDAEPGTYLIHPTRPVTMAGGCHHRPFGQENLAERTVVPRPREPGRPGADYVRPTPRIATCDRCRRQAASSAWAVV